MNIFSSSIPIPAGAVLAGYQDRIHIPTTDDGELEIHGLGFDQPLSGLPWELCGVDALYAGVLATRQPADGVARVVAASHTHYAPMLDASKPRLGVQSHDVAEAFQASIDRSPRRSVSPDRCVVFKMDVPVPVYRRFDYPATAVNRWLTKHAGFYPNDAHPVDRGLYLVVFFRGDEPLASIATHACHPMTRSDAHRASPDYVKAVRDGVRARFGLSHCLFLLGCNGDVRANLAEKRVRWLPRFRLNWRFKRAPSVADQARVDQLYRQAVMEAETMDEFPFVDADARVTEHDLQINGMGPVRVPRLDLGDRLSFTFMPFEVSHRYRLESLASGGHAGHFIVSCAGDTRGYLPYPDQLQAGGYEVDASRAYMNQPGRIDARPSLIRAT